MGSRSLSRVAALGFLALGLSLVSLRYRAREEARVEEEESRWRLRYDVSFAAVVEGASVSIAVPTSSPAYNVEKGEVSQRGLELTAARTEGASRTQTQRFTARHMDNYRISAEFELLLPADDAGLGNAFIEGLSDEAKARYLRSEPDLPTQSSNVQQALQEAPKGGAAEGESLQWAFDRCSQQMRTTKAEEGGDDAALALSSSRASDLGRARAMVTLCRAMRIPARLVVGFELRQNDDAKPLAWVEAFHGSRWLPFAPQYGYARRLPGNFVPIRRGGEQILELSKGIRPKLPADLKGAENEPDSANVRYSIERLGPSLTALRRDIRRPSQIVDLTQLPVDMHHVLSLMLLLPFGALIASVFRNIIGIRTFGTFSPALMAMSFLYAAWGTGLLILSAVVGCGIIGRSLLERLQLLLVPRLSIILTTIILCVVFGVSFLDYMNVTPSADAVLLPLVILTIMIERLYVASEEDGVAFSLQLAVGTLAVAACCYLVLSWERVGKLILVYPEIHFATIAALIFIGRYSNYRLTELIRFRDLVKVEGRTP